MSAPHQERIGARAPAVFREALSAGKHICLVDYGNYHFLFDLVTSWPAELGRMSYLFGTAQVGRNTAASKVDTVVSGGVVRGIHADQLSSAEHFVARRRVEVQAAKAALKQLDELNPDVVIGANNPLDIQAQVVKWCRQRGKPFLFWLQDLRGAAIRSILSDRIPVLGSMVGMYYTSLERRLLKNSAHVISIAEEFCPEVLSTGLEKEKITVIPNWAPLDRIPLRPKSNAWSRQHGLDQKRVVLYTGNLGMKHNPALLLKLCEALKDTPDAVVAVVAEGVGATWLAAQAKERGITNVFLNPFVTAEELPDVLGAADVCVAVLEREASAYSVPSKIWTYFCAGKPVILSVPGENQAALIVKRIGVGLSSDPDQESQFVTDCIDTLAKSPEERAAIGARGRHYAESHFSMDLIIQRVSQCIDSALRA